ncbi:MAG: YggT family protein [Gammaproteobacteria bacterium]
MGTFSEILRYLLQSALGLFLFAVLLRMLLPVARADFYNPVSQFVVKVTQPVLGPLRRLLPPLGRLDTASLLLATGVQVLSIMIALALLGFRPANVLLIVVWALLGIASLVVNMYFFAILGVIIFSWIAPHSQHPALALLYQLTEPVMAPVRRLLPPLGGLDLSPILVFVGINVIEILLRGIAREFSLPPGVVPGL